MQSLILDSYLAMIKNSVGARMFKNFYCFKKKKIDVLKNGRLSCAFYVSSILKLFNLISRPHPTVKSTIKDMQANGWEKIKTPKVGAVLRWEKQKGHEHLGFYIGNQKAVSNSSQKGVPVIHHWTYNGKRKIIAIYWSKKLIIPAP